MSCVRVALLLLASGAGSALTLPALPSTLPLLHFNLDKFLLPGESRRLRIVKAESLTALDAALANGDNLLGSLITTPAGNALSTASVLHVREVRRHPALYLPYLFVTGNLSVNLVPYLLLGAISSLFSGRLGVVELAPYVVLIAAFMLIATRKNS